MDRRPIHSFLPNRADGNQGEGRPGRVSVRVGISGAGPPAGPVRRPKPIRHKSLNIHKLNSIFRSARGIVSFRQKRPAGALDAGERESYDRVAAVHGGYGPCRQRRGVHEQRVADAAGAAPPDDAADARPEAAVPELPPVPPGPTEGHLPLPGSGPRLAHPRLRGVAPLRSGPVDARTVNSWKCRMRQSPARTGRVGDGPGRPARENRFKSINWLDLRRIGFGRRTGPARGSDRVTRLRG
jgi:hypothetical protein